MASSLPAVRPGRDPGQALLCLAPRQSSGASICASWAEPGTFLREGTVLRALSPGQQVLSTGVSGCHGSEHEFCFGLHWVCCHLKAASLAASAFFVHSFFVVEEGEPCSCQGLGCASQPWPHPLLLPGSSCWAMVGTLEGSLGMFQGLPQSKSGRALWKALPAGSRGCRAMHAVLAHSSHKNHSLSRF